MLIATLVFRFPQAFSGVRALWLLLVAPAAQLGALAVGIPAFSVLNTDLPQAIRWIGVAASLGLGLLAMDRIIRFATGKTDVAAPDAESGKRPAAEPARP